MTINEGLSVRQLEALVRKVLTTPDNRKKSVADEVRLPDEYNRLLQQMGRYFSNEISLRRTPSGKGTMTVRFKSDDEVRALLRVLEGSED